MEDRETPRMARIVMAAVHYDTSVLGLCQFQAA